MITETIQPAAVVAARSVADIRAGVLSATERELPVAVRSTGHGSLVAPVGALMVDTSGMTGVAVDADHRTVRVRPGARWSDVISAARPYGLSPVSGDTASVGVVGYTFGGGVGWLSRKYGYGADNLIRAQLVTADGRLLTASADDHPDLFWAIRGGSGNFGIATELEIRLVPVARVLTGTAYVSIDRAAEAVRWFGDHAPELPDDCTVALRLLRESPLPGHDGPVLAVGLVQIVDDDHEDGRATMKRLQPLIGDAVADDFGVVPYAEASVPGVRPQGFEMYEELPDELIKVAVDSVLGSGGANALEIRHWGGATAKPAANAGPVGHRRLPFSIKIDGGPEIVSQLADFATGATFLNFLSDPTRTRSAYRAADYYRLREIKRRYDPLNTFRVNHNITPA